MTINDCTRYELDESSFCGDTKLNVALQKYNIILNDQVPSVDGGGKTRAEVHTGSESARVLVHSISTVNGNQAEKTVNQEIKFGMITTSMRSPLN